MGHGGRMSQRPMVPARAPQHNNMPAHPPAAQPRQPGMFAQMASTAAGVAVGSAVGHTVGAAMTGGMGGGNQQEMAPQQQQPMQAGYGQQPLQPVYGQPQPGYGQEMQPACQYEMKQFMDCAQSQYDIAMCQGFNEALKQCKMANGMSA